jgi:hypothetical protein
MQRACKATIYMLGELCMQPALRGWTCFQDRSAPWPHGVSRVGRGVPQLHGMPLQAQGSACAAHSRPGSM